MVNSFSLWIESIVIIIVLASLVEMLLPPGGLQRLVRVIMGLFVLLTLLNPLLSLVGQKTFLEERLSELNIAVSAGSSAEKIVARGEELAKTNRSLVLDELREKIARAGEKRALAVAGVQAATVEAGVAGGPAAEGYRLEWLRLTVGAGREGGPAGTGSVAAVKPISIGGTVPQNLGTEASALTAAEKERLRRDLIDALCGEFGLTPERISINFSN